MQRIMESLGNWMSSNRLRLNASKKQYIWLGNGQWLKNIDPQSISADFPYFVFVTSVRNLGVVLGHELTFSKHLLISYAVLEFFSCSNCGSFPVHFHPIVPLELQGSMSTFCETE